MDARKSTRRSWRTLALAGAAASAPALAQPVFTPLPTNFRPMSMRADGSMLGGGYDFDVIDALPGTWTPEGGVLPLSPPTGFNSGEVFGLSADGSVAAGVTSVDARWDRNRATIWRNGQPQVLGLLPGGYNSVARAVSADGSTTVGWGSTGTGGTQAFRWTPEQGMQDLGTENGFETSEALGASNDGSFIVGNTEAGACRWNSAGEVLMLGPAPGGSVAWASTISADGRVIAGTADILVPDSWPRYGFFRWTEQAGMEFLGRLNTEHDTAMSVATNMSADGNVLVGFNTVDGESSALYWSRASGLVDLNAFLPSLGVDLGGVRLTYPTATSADGSVIAGFGYRPDGGYVSWVVAGVPAPSVLVVAAMGVPVLMRRRRA